MRTLCALGAIHVMTSTLFDAVPMQLPLGMADRTTARPNGTAASGLGRDVDRLTHWVVRHIVDRFSVALSAAVIVWALILASYFGA